MDGGAWWAAVHGVAEGRTRLSDFALGFHFHAWRVPGTGEPGGLPSMRSHTVGHDWGDLAAAAASKFLAYDLEQEASSSIKLKVIMVGLYVNWKQKLKK